ncbi:hypothetical protein [Deinococcus cellulosilyticus]|uniref:Peptidase M30 n=1 Tax=Deinococcus cellulosilyticus (strain DSM 18568 / NBRC 106333 / KACC 11606 / 5516J-15) TaxID=1223518 RepID=A0A511NA73_DEIC1|nr:hypothetical protein [Deinococcus cellulosilyticus]GEM49729.1 hypothetical protein DC3_53640 [Deinococcus cellulosilyticus NBRC 106333 = KACC 11606]
MKKPVPVLAAALLLTLTGCQSPVQTLPPEVHYEQHVFRPQDFQNGQVTLTLKNLTPDEGVAVIPVNAEQPALQDGFTYQLLVDGVAVPEQQQVSQRQQLSFSDPSETLRDHPGVLQHQQAVLQKAMQKGWKTILNVPIRKQEVNCTRPAPGALCPYWIYGVKGQVQVMTEMRLVSANAYWFVDRRDNADLSDAELAAFAKTFEEKLYPTDVRYFGAPVDFDGNGKIRIVFSREVAQGGAYGYVDPMDWFPDEIEHSNGGDVFYAATPSSFLPRTSRESMLQYDLPSTLVHELKHLIALGNRFVQGKFPEDSWLEEASAVAAEELSGYGTQKGNYARNKAAWGLASPQNVRVDPGVLGNREADHFYGYNFLFLWWLAEQKGHDHFWKRLTQGSLTGQQNLSQVMGQPFAELMLAWAQVLMFSNTGISTRKNYQSLDLREALHGQVGTSWTLLGYRPLQSQKDTARSMAYYVGRGKNQDATITLKTRNEAPYLVVVRFKGQLPWGPANALSGSLQLPAGETAYGLTLTACLLQEGICSKASPKRKVPVYQKGHEATFSLTGLLSGAYHLEAFRDENASGLQDTGDLYGCVKEADTCAQLIPTRENLVLNLEILP